MQIGACYIRVSTDDQVEYSPDAQLRAIREYAKHNDILLSDEYIFKDDGISGRRADKRPAFQRMISIAKKKPKQFDVILVHRFDRFARSREDSIVYKSLLRKDCGIRVISITEPLEDDKISVLMEAMLEAMAEYYSLNLADEVKKGMFEKARKGENIGKASYGYELVDGELVPEQEASQIVKLIFDRYQQTGSFTSVARYLNSNKIPTKTSGRWTPTTIAYILENPVYMGMLRYNYRKKGQKKYQNDKSEWILSMGTHEPLISKDLFEETQAKIKRNDQLWNRNYSDKNIRHWAQNLVKCDKCGGTMTINSCDGGKFRSYRCQLSGIGSCKGGGMSTRKIGIMIIKKLYDDLSNLDSLTIEKIYDQSQSDDLELLNAQLKKIDTKLDLIKRSYLAQVDTLEEYKKNKEQLQKEEAEILEAIDKIVKTNDGSKVKSIKPIQLENFICLLENEDITIEEKNRAAKQFIKEVRFNPETRDLRIIYFI